MSSPIRWGFLGAGSISRALAAAVHATSDAALQAVAARDPVRARRLGPEGRVYSSYEDLLADPDIDAVYINLANDAHVPWTLAALEAGKPVLCEKPLGLHAGQVEQVVAATERTGLLAVEAAWNRWHPRTRRAQALLRSGALGSVRAVRSGFVYDGAEPGNYRLDPAMGGGALYDTGCYATAGALWAFDWAAPHRVRASMRVGPSGVDVDTRATLDFEGGSADVRCGMTGPVTQELVVEGDEGRLQFDSSPFSSKASPSALVVSGQVEHFAPCDPYQLMVEACCDRLRGGPGWIVPLAESLRVAQTLDAVFASATRDVAG